MTGATSYNIYRSTTGNFAGAFVTTAYAPTTSYTDDGGIGSFAQNTFVQNAPVAAAGVSPGVGTYFYVITATTASGQTLSSSVQNITTVANTQNVSLSWAAVPGASSYSVYRSASSNFTNALLLTTTGGTSYVDGGTSAGTGTPFVANVTNGGGLASGTTYYYIVAAVKAAGETAEVSAAVTTAVGQQSVSLSWAAVNGATAYNIYRSTTQGSFANSLLATTSGLTYSDNGATTVLAGTPFVQNAPLLLAASGAQVSITTVNLITGAITAVAAVPTAGGSGYAPNSTFNLQVTGAGGAGGIVQATTNILGQVISFTLIAGGTGYAVNANATTEQGSLALNTTFYYLVTASTIAGEVMASSVQSVTTSAASNQTAELSWAPVIGATAYNIYRTTAPGIFVNSANNLLATVANSVTSFVDDGTQILGVGTLFNQVAPTPAAGGALLSGTTYYYLITATSPLGAISVSNVQSIVPTPGSQMAQLSWAAGVPGSTYNVYRSTTNGNFGVNSLLTTTALPAYTDNGSLFNGSATFAQFGALTAAGGTLTVGTTYYYVVNAVDVAGATIGVSSEQSATPTTGNQSVNLLWASVPGAVVYYVYRSTTPDLFNVNSFIGLTSATSFADTGTAVIGAATPFVQNVPVASAGGSLAVGTTFYYDITAVLGAGEISASIVQSFVASTGNQTANLSWAAVPGATSYKIYRSTSVGNFASSLLTTVAGTMLTYADNGSIAAGAASPATTTVSDFGDLVQGGTANATPFQYFSLGPTPTMNSQVFLNGGGVAQNTTGPITGVAVSPLSTQTIVISTAGGGEWQTTDGGAHWTPVLTSVPNAVLFGGAVAIAPSDPNIVYFGSGQANNSTDSYYGSGVYMNGNLLTDPVIGNPLVGKAIGQIVVNPTDPYMIWVAVSDEATNGTVGNAGIWRYDGVHWINLTDGPNAISPAVDADYTSVVYQGGELFAAVNATGLFTQFPVTATVDPFSGLSLATTYTYVINAVDASGHRFGASTTQVFTTSATTFEDDNLSWVPVAGAVTYDIYRNGFYLDTVNAPQTDYTDVGFNTDGFHTPFIPNPVDDVLVCQDPTAVVPILSGLSTIDLSSGAAVNITSVNAVTGAITGISSVPFAQGGGYIPNDLAATATAVLTGGSITSLTLGIGGSGYTGLADRDDQRRRRCGSPIHGEYRGRRGYLIQPNQRRCRLHVGAHGHDQWARDSGSDRRRRGRRDGRRQHQRVWSGNLLWAGQPRQWLCRHHGRGHRNRGHGGRHRRQFRDGRHHHHQCGTRVWWVRLFAQHHFRPADCRRRRLRHRRRGAGDHQCLWPDHELYAAGRGPPLSRERRGCHAARPGRRHLRLRRHVRVAAGRFDCQQRPGRHGDR